MPPKKGEKKKGRVEFAAEDKLLAYLDDLIELGGFENSYAEIARSFVWKEVNRLLEVRRLKQK